MNFLRFSSGRAICAASIASGLGWLTTAPAVAQTTHRPAALSLESGRPTPFADNNGLVPTKGQYDGPLFKLNPAWPTSALPPIENPPWIAAIHGEKITPENAGAYANALREYISKTGRELVMHYDTWDAVKAHWYNEPWLGSKREAIHGTYAAGEFGPAIFPDTGLRTTFTTQVLTYYDERAASTLGRIWGQTALKPDVQTARTQFDEGSVVVKAAAFTSADPKQPTDWWDAMKGAQEWPVYISPGAKDPAAPQVWPSYIAQFDIIVKDTKSAPKTGWVFTTLVYDSAAPGDAWDKMIVLGAQWGNDPQATKPGDPLVENWINPKAPKYSTQTLGWGGRLSGPNDGARNDIMINGKAEKNAPDSSCMSCHSTAQWNVADHRMLTFLLPSFPQSTPPYFQTSGQYIVSPEPASPAWMKWFTNRLGTQPMDEGSVATDFDEVTSFKSLGLWWQAVGPQPASAVLTAAPNTPAVRYNEYNGAPIPDSAAGQ